MSKHQLHDAGRKPNCRFCKSELTATFVDLGMSPLCQTQIHPTELNRREVFYPLHVYVCDQCYLVQLEEFVAPAEIFSSDYPYFSSYSDSWVNHARRYSEEMIAEFELGNDSLVMEVASNDGYLLQHFVAKHIPVLGIEPAGNVARAAVEKGVPTETCFFGRREATRIASNSGRPDLIVANNVIAHVPDIIDFVSGFRVLLGDAGVVTLEFPHLLNLIQDNQFDTIYHEHFSYLSLTTLQAVLASEGLRVFRVEQLPTHGGSLRVFACHESNGSIRKEQSVDDLLGDESDFGLRDMAIYDAYTERVKRTKRHILRFLVAEKSNGSTIVGYGAPGKGNTLLNYCGIRTDFLDYTVDRNPNKYGTYTPGTRIPIFHPDVIRETRPDFVFILPWNLADEIIAQTSYIREWGGRWVIPIPDLRIID